MDINLKAAQLTRNFLIPLCAETSYLFAPVTLRASDRLKLTLSKDGKKFIAEIYAVIGDQFGSASWEARGRWITRIPERKESVSSQMTICYHFAATDFTALIINAVWPAEQIVYGDEGAKTTYDYLLSRFVVQAGMAHMMAELKNGQRVKLPFKLADHAELPLNAYQRVAGTCAYQQEGYGLFMEQGTGKTPIVINRICNEARALRQAAPAEVIAQAHRLIENAKQQAARKAVELMDSAKARAKAKRDQLEKLAKDKALRKQVSINFTGMTAEALREVQRAIRQVELEAAEDLRLAAEEADRFEQNVIWQAEGEAKLYAETIINDAVLRAKKMKTDAASAQPKNKRMYRALIVVPKNIRTNWRNEICRFAFTAGKVTIVRGSELERTKSLIEAFTPDEDCEWTVVICSYESLLRSWEAFQMTEWDLCVLDEAHYIKNHNTKRTKKCLELRDHCKQRMVVTGTPIANTLFDIYTQLEFLGEGWSGFQSYQAFKQYYGKWAKEASHNKLFGFKNLPLMQERLARVSFLIRKSEALPDLPKHTYDVVEVEMSPKQVDLYTKVQTQLAVEIEADMQRAENRQLLVNNVLTKLMRLAQITSGFISWDPIYSDDGEILQPKTIDRLDPNPKLEELVTLLKEKGSDEKTIIWACWVQDIKTISSRLALEGIDCVTFYGGTSDADREEHERRFNDDPKCKVFIGNAAAGGVGLNLVGYDWWNGAEAKRTSNADHVIHYSQNWSMIHRGQSDARCDRMNTRAPVRYTDLCVPDTVDEEIRARVLGKQKQALAIQDVRDILRRVLETKVECDD